MKIERHDENDLPSGWDHGDLRAARAFGNDWVRERRSAALVVPSVVARREGNLILNPQHADFAAITVGSTEPVLWDARLFGKS